MQCSEQTFREWVQDTKKHVKGCTTAQVAIESGCLRADLVFDWKHKYVEVFNPAILQGCVEPGPMVDDSQGLRYAEWDKAKLVLLPKKGDLSLCKNLRGICLLDIASKILSLRYLFGGCRL